MPPEVEMMTGYLAADGFLGDVARELGEAVGKTHGRLVIADGPERPAAFAANLWRNPQKIEIASIGDAVKKLKAIQRNWALYPYEHQGRARLIHEQLPKVSAKPLRFGDPAPKAPLGSFTLLEPGLMLASADCSSPFSNGEIAFVEDREGPPSRAYLKLWEVFTRLGVRPLPGDLCLDLGSAPGGWTYVLAKLDAVVTSVDKAELDPRVLALPGVTHLRQSAFGLDPRHAEPVDWLFSDVICYPERMLRLVTQWLEAGKARRFVITLKFQGDTDFATVRAFRAIPGGKVMHLHNNKHELTFAKL